MRLTIRLVFILLVGIAISSSIIAAPLKPIIIRPNQPIEKSYLVENRSACIETGVDPRTPFIRVGDGEEMYYVYKFSPGKGNMAFLLLNVSSQFLISASNDNGKTYQVISSMKECEQVGTRVFIDLTPLAKKTGEVLLKFEDKHKEDGWGALTSEIRYYNAGKGSDTRIILDRWKVNGSPYQTGKSILSSKKTVFTTEFKAPEGWWNQDLAVYFSDFLGNDISAKLNGKKINIGRTWDSGYWADISKTIKSGSSNVLEVAVNPSNGKAGLWTPVRVGLRYPACAVPLAKNIDDSNWMPNRNFEPYKIDEMNFLSGNFMQTLYDDRYNLLAFAPAERMTVHYLHDTFRSLVALAEEERHTPAARVELVRKLYAGCKDGLLPGGEYLYSFKHDQRPIDIRPYPDSTDLIMVQKMDNWTYLCPIGVALGTSKTSDKPTVKDTKLNQKKDAFSFKRQWKFDDRIITGSASYHLGDSGIPPSIEFQLDGKGAVKIDFKELSEQGKWFVPGSWGAEAVMLPDGETFWAYKQNIEFKNPAFDYFMIRGGNGSVPIQPCENTYAKALMIMWSVKPDSITTSTKDGSRFGKQINNITLEYKNESPAKVKITLMPFQSYPESLITPRTIAENILKTGKTGTGIYDCVTTANGSGIGPDGLAAAAYIFKKYNCPEAKEAETLAVDSMRAFINLDKAGAQTNELYYLISGCMYLHLLGYTEFDEWARIWADRMLASQNPDGSWRWLNFQLRCMEGLMRAYELLGDQKYLDAVNLGLKTLEYKDNNLYWKGNVSRDDFCGATTYALFGNLGIKDLAQKALDARKHYIDDRGFFACSDLNPYMLGFAAAGLDMPKEPKQIVGLTESIIYNYDGVKVQNMPTCYVVNQHHPLADTFNFKLEE